MHRLLDKLRAAPRAIAFFFSLLVPAAVYLGLFLAIGPVAPQLLLALLVVGLGFLLGLGLSGLARPGQRTGVTAAATAGLLVGWVVVVVLTWGFALRGAPVLLAYAAACHLGQRIGSFRAV